MRRLRNITALGLLAVGTALGSVGCVENESSLFIQGVFDLSRSRCVAEPDADAVLLAGGSLDRAFARGYTAALLVGSHLTERGSRENLRTETSRLAIEGAHVTLFGTNGGSVEFDSIATGLVHPASGTDPGLAAVFAQLVRPEDLGDPTVPGDYGSIGPPGQAIVRVRVFGTTLGGQEIESGDYDFPIFVCEGCLISYPPEASDPDSNPNDGYRCSTDADTEVVDVEYCYIGQDSTIPCTACAATSTICRNPFENPWYYPN